ncbi:MAG: hypothetical protein ACR2P3_02120 [Geminicoccaceae bacterium]
MTPNCLPINGQKKALEILDLDTIGGEFGLRNGVLEIHIQRVEGLDLEQNDNFWEKVIHIMWKDWVEESGGSRRDKNQAGPWTLGTS